MGFLTLAVAAMCSLFVVAKPSEATLINFTFTGQVGNVTGGPGGLPEDLNAGFGLINGSMLVNSATTLVPSPGIHSYADKITGLQLTLNSGSTNYQFSLAAGSNSITMINDLPNDQFLAVSPAGGPLGGLPISGLYATSFNLVLFNNLGTAFTNLDLDTPNLPPSLGDWSGTSWRLAFNNGDVAVGTAQQFVNNSGALASGRDSLRRGSCGIDRSWRQELAAGASLRLRLRLRLSG